MTNLIKNGCVTPTPHSTPSAPSLVRDLSVVVEELPQTLLGGVGGEVLDHDGGLRPCAISPVVVQEVYD